MRRQLMRPRSLGVRWSSSMQSIQLKNGKVVYFFKSVPAKPMEELTPTLVLFHGFASSHHCFKHMWPHLTSKYPLIAFDLPGTGDSDVAATGNIYDANTVHQALVEATNSLIGARTPIVFVGHSLGGHSALRMTSEYIEKKMPVNGLVLISSAALRPYPLMRALYLFPHRFMMRYPIFLMRLVQLLGFSDTHPAVEYVYGAIRATTTPYSLLAEKTQVIAKSNLPNLCISAKDDPFLTSRLWERLCASLGPRGTVLSYETGKHNLPKSQSEAVAHDIDRWISTLAKEE